MPKESKTGKKRKGRKFPSHLKAMISEMSLLFSNGDFKAAMKKCEAIVKEDPRIPDPYHVLGLIYEKNGDITKAFDSLMIAVQLDPRQVQIWRKVAELSELKGDKDTAALCYSRITRIDPNDIDSIQKRIDLYTESGRAKKLLSAQIDLFKALKTTQVLYAAELGLEIVKNLHELEKEGKAIELLQEIVASCMEEPIDNDDQMTAGLHAANMLTDLLIQSKAYKQSCTVIGKVDQVLRARNTPLPLDLAVKYGIAQLHLGNKTDSERCFTHLFKEVVEDLHDLYLDVADAFAEAKDYRRAINIYRQIRAVPELNVPVVWMKQARCHRELGHIDTAMQLFAEVVTAVPGNTAIVLEIAEFLTGRARRPLEALVLLSRPDIMKMALEKDSALAVKLKMEHIRVLISLKRHNDVFEICDGPGGFLHFALGRARGERGIVLQSKSQTLKVTFDFRGLDFNDALRFLGQILESYRLSGHSKESTRLLKHMSLDPVLKLSKTQVQHLHIVGIASSWSAGDYDVALKGVRELHAGNVNNKSLWKLYAIMSSHGSPVSASSKFLVRMLHFNPYNHMIMTLVAGTALSTGNNLRALAEFYQVLRSNPEDAFTNMCIGINWINMFMSRTMTDRSLGFMRALAFMRRYAMLRLQSAEEETANKMIENVDEEEEKEEEKRESTDNNSNNELNEQQQQQQHGEEDMEITEEGEEESKNPSEDNNNNNDIDNNDNNDEKTIENENAINRSGVSYLQDFLSTLRAEDDKTESSAESSSKSNQISTTGVKAVGSIIVPHWLKKQEVYYNTGRLYHQAGLTYLAKPYYENVLQIHDEMSANEDKEIQSQLHMSLAREAAFNLTLIYRKAGSPMLIRKLMKKYLVIE